MYDNPFNPPQKVLKSKLKIVAIYNIESHYNIGRKVLWFDFFFKIFYLFDGERENLCF